MLALDRGMDGAALHVGLKVSPDDKTTLGSGLCDPVTGLQRGRLEATVGRKRSSTLDDVVEVTTRLPWWVGVLLAAASFLLFSALAAQPMVTSGASVNFMAILASVLRFVAPAVFLVGAAGSAIGRIQRKALLTSASSGDPASAVAAMSWREFELLLGEAFRRDGYRVIETGGGGADGGVDLVLLRDGRTTLVQCKHWKTYRVGVQVVREMFGLMTHRQAGAGIVVTSGRFTDDARAFVSGKPLTLVDGEALAMMLRRGVADQETALPPAGQAQQPPGEPACPVCGRAMIRRQARTGPNAGSTFWGCRSFPGCKGTRSLV